MTERAHNPAGCDCDPCHPELVDSTGPDSCIHVEDGFRASLEMWKSACDCCFSEAFPEGIDGALARARD
ncbi:MAG: hypothetical protein ACREOM_10790 [Candidatus Dormibacteraceae bacterium]